MKTKGRKVQAGQRAGLPAREASASYRNGPLRTSWWEDALRAKHVPSQTSWWDHSPWLCIRAWYCIKRPVPSVTDVDKLHGVWWRATKTARSVCSICCRRKGWRKDMGLVSLKKAMAASRHNLPLPKVGQQRRPWLRGANSRKKSSGYTRQQDTLTEHMKQSGTGTVSQTAVNLHLWTPSSPRKLLAVSRRLD